MEIHRARGDLLRQGDALRRLGIRLGANGALAEATAVLAEAVTVLEQVPAGPELARAYNAMAAVLGVFDDGEALRWGQKAIDLAERVGCVDAIADTLNIVGTAQLRLGDLDGLVKLDRSREMAQQAGDELGVVRAYERPAAVLAARREWMLAERYIEPGLVFCRERGLESSLAWLTVLAAEAGLARGRWDDAASTAGTILTWPAEGFSHPRVSALVILARVRARRGEPGYRPLLDEAASIAKAAPTVQAALLIGAARAEAAWLEGAPAERIGAETASAGEPGPSDVRWFAGETEVWRHRAALRRALDLLQGLGAHPAAAAVARRLRALGEQGIPRGPRAATAANPAGLTRREAEVLQLVAAGLSNTDIAAQLVVSDRTVDNHVSAIFRKLGARTRGEASARAVRLGLAGSAGDEVA